LRTYILIAVGFLQGCGNLLWNDKNTVIKETPNTLESLKLTLFIKEGGATVGNSYQISALPVDAGINDSDIGNLFVADAHDGPISEDTSRVTFHWVGNDTAVVSFDQKLRVFKKETKIGSLVIIYDTINLTR
jgi:hypothetical protein